MQEESGTYAVQVTDVAGFTGDVTFAVSSVPPIAAELTVNPQVVTAPGTATLNVATTLATVTLTRGGTTTTTVLRIARRVRVSLMER